MFDIGLNFESFLQYCGTIFFLEDLLGVNRDVRDSFFVNLLGLLFEKGDLIRLTTRSRLCRDVPP
jgi:hypothetical protein